MVKQRDQVELFTSKVVFGYIATVELEVELERDRSVLKFLEGHLRYVHHADSPASLG
jgi:hypothetical protein